MHTECAVGSMIESATGEGGEMMLLSRTHGFICPERSAEEITIDILFARYKDGNFLIQL